MSYFYAKDRCPHLPCASSDICNLEIFSSNGYAWVKQRAGLHLPIMMRLIQSVREARSDSSRYELQKAWLNDNSCYDLPDGCLRITTEYIFIVRFIHSKP